MFCVCVYGLLYMYLCVCVCVYCGITRGQAVDGCYIPWHSKQPPKMAPSKSSTAPRAMVTWTAAGAAARLNEEGLKDSWERVHEGS